MQVPALRAKEHRTASALLAEGCVAVSATVPAALAVARASDRGARARRYLPRWQLRCVSATVPAALAVARASDRGARARRCLPRWRLRCVSATVPAALAVVVGERDRACRVVESAQRWVRC